ncbi:glucose-6-phosphate isomerase [Sphingomonas rhizophila]|uniref:Glucose-6-phosphate isomerase n=1 Tax=Sphingomonas rhizophila TaxID=2071607 RepID=A0A7G9S8D2_9SPHN|nr:glucose-6-phosphate isomerase [Sphingomonas rhizophila]QNN64107.1 glucose-6-phosphate isomerase [Sphingomonas rhizophila]
MAILDTTGAWQAIDAHHAVPLTSLFEQDEGRVGRLCRDLAGIHFDLSKTHLDDGLVSAFCDLAEQAGYGAARDALFAGAVVNPSEDRSATHTAERGQGSPADVDLASQRRARMRSLLDAIEGGAFGDIESVLHIGIGGSALGPDLVIDALGRDSDRIEVRVLSNIDGEAFDEAVSGLDPATTLVVAVSKTFSTIETLTNLEAAIEWLVEGGVDDAYGQLIAVTAAPDKAIRFGIDQTRVLPFGEGVGGRYSMWSSVGLSIALALGWSAFEEMLEGAAIVDRHVRSAKGADNVALLAAFADTYYAQVRRAETRAVFAYDERLRLLPNYLQQLEMESNGKSATRDGGKLDRPSAPITWGGTGTDAQHAVFQLLHQGTHIVPVEFVAVVENEDSLDPRHHRMLLLNCIGQAAALMKGRDSDDAARFYAGDRPSMTLLLERLDARTLGALIAFYEHRTFANAVLIGINPFDQFGVELGKEIALSLDDPESRDGLDASTRALLDKAGL